MGVLRGVEYRGGDTLLVSRVQRERDILADTAALGTVFLVPADHVALQGIRFLHYADPTLVAAGVAAALIEGAGSLGYIYAGVRIV